MGEIHIISDNSRWFFVQGQTRLQTIQIANFEYDLRCFFQ